MPVLVLNTSLQPLSVIHERRLVVLLSKQKVAFVDENVRRLIEEGIDSRRLPTDEPVIVQLLANVRVPRMILRPTRANILLRDDETCQYCGRRQRDLTLDHVLPRSRGGQSTWENLVACCRACNGRKGNRLPKEVGMHLIRQPKPLNHEYVGFFLLRYPRLREAYEAFLLSAQTGV
jgi:hypothetical protein